MKKKNEIACHRTVKQCPYCKNFFAKSDANMKKYTRICGGKEGVVCSFNNGDIISFQDNFKYF